MCIAPTDNAIGDRDPHLLQPTLFPIMEFQDGYLKRPTLIFLPLNVPSLYMKLNIILQSLSPLSLFCAWAFWPAVHSAEFTPFDVTIHCFWVPTLRARHLYWAIG